MKCMDYVQVDDDFKVPPIYKLNVDVGAHDIVVSKEFFGAITQPHVPHLVKASVLAFEWLETKADGIRTSHARSVRKPPSA